MLVLKILKDLVKPVSQLIKDLSDKQLDEAERSELVMEFSVAVAQIVDDVLVSKK